MDKLSNQTKNLMKLTQELLVSADYLNEISNLSYLSRGKANDRLTVRCELNCWCEGGGERCWSLSYVPT